MFLFAVGDTADEEIIESAAVYLFSVFKTADKVSQKQTSTIRSVFGPFPASVATKICTVVNKITSTLPDDIIPLLGNKEREEGDGAATSTEFGQSIKFAYQKPCRKCGDLSSSDSEDERLLEVNLNYSKKPQAACKEPELKADTSSAVNAGWLQKEVEKYYGTVDSTDLGMSLEDFTTTIFDVLSSPKSDSELQNEVMID